MKVLVTGGMGFIGHNIVIGQVRGWISLYNRGKAKSKPEVKNSLLQEYTVQF